VHLSKCLASTEIDFVADFAGLLPMDVISETIGVPEADREKLRRLSDIVVHREDGLFDVPRAGMEAALELVGYYADMIAARRAATGSRDDLTDALLTAEIDGDRLTDDEIIGFLLLMGVAGNETTTKLLANAVYWGWRNPAELAGPMDAGLTAAWVEETLRYDSTSQLLARTVTADFTAYGQTVPAGHRLLLLIGAANRDPVVFTDPDVYDLGRDTSNFISFGAGRHYCLGASLARLEARIALSEFTRRVSRFDIDEPRAERVHSANVRGFASLPMTVGVR